MATSLTSRSLVSTCIALPGSVIAVIGLWAFASNPAGAWTWPPDEVTLSEAVATANYAEVARQLESGANPNPATKVRAGLLGRAVVQVTPLQAAVWGRNARIMQMLIDGGAVVGPTDHGVLRCLNEEHDDRDVRTILERMGPANDRPCTEITIPR